MRSHFCFKWLNNTMHAFYIFSEQIYYAGPANNLGFDIPKVRFCFAILFYYLIIILSSSSKNRMMRLVDKEEEERRRNRELNS